MRSIYQRIVKPTLLVLGMASCLCSHAATPLRFRHDGTFRIAQFTDLHWDNNSPKCKETVATIRQILEVEKPDLAVLTGDIVTSVPAREGWLAIAAIFEEAKTPFAVTLGNHDAEPEINRSQIFDLLQGKPYFVGEHGSALHGAGNYALPVLSSDEKITAAVVYCLDSNDYPSDKRIQNYDWIQFDQIAWYRNTSDHYTAANQQSPVPSLAFFHIPLVEYKNIVTNPTTLGEVREEVCSSDINSGFFASMIEKKDIMGVFVGHDHDNNFIGIEKDIALGYGQITGASAYGNLERGARIIELHQHQFSFNTWIRTASGVQFHYNYPSGMSSDTTALKPHPAKQVGNLKPGIRFNYYEGGFKSTAELADAKIKDRGVLKNITIEQAAAKDSFAYAFHGYVKIPKSGLYRFYTYSDDGSSLFINGQEVVNNDGSHGLKRANGEIALQEGFHEFKLLYFESYMGNQLEVGISSLSIRECKIPDNFLFYE